MNDSYEKSIEIEGKLLRIYENFWNLEESGNLQTQTVL